MYFQNRLSAPSILQPAGLERGRREQEHRPAHGVRGRQPGDREAAPRGRRGPGRPEQVGEDAGSADPQVAKAVQGLMVAP